jgi:hypothetical protein
LGVKRVPQILAASLRFREAVFYFKIYNIYRDNITEESMRNFDELTEDERIAYREYFEKRDQNDIRIADKMFDLALTIGNKNPPVKVYRLKSFNQLLIVLINEGYHPTTDVDIWNSGIPGKPFYLNWLDMCGKEIPEDKIQDGTLLRSWMDVVEEYR